MHFSQDMYVRSWFRFCLREREPASLFPKFDAWKMHRVSMIWPRPLPRVTTQKMLEVEMVIEAEQRKGEILFCDQAKNWAQGDRILFRSHMQRKESKLPHLNFETPRTFLWTVNKNVVSRSYFHFVQMTLFAGLILFESWFYFRSKSVQFDCLFFGV